MIEILSNSAMFAEGWLSFVGSLVVAGIIFGSVKGWSGIRLATFWLLWQLSMQTDDTLNRNITATTANMDAITGKISRGEGTAGALINERELYDRLNAMTARIDRVVGTL